MGQTRPPSFHATRNFDPDEDTESAITSVSQQAANLRSRSRRHRQHHPHHGGGLPPLPGPGIQPPMLETETSSSMMSSEIESSIYESEDVQSQASSRYYFLN